MSGGVAPRPAAERFWAKVDQANGPNACWLWIGYCSRNGYGRFCPEPRKKNPGPSVAAHRFAYEALVGPIPAGRQLDHMCRVRNCVNPAHLRPVTNKENHENVLVRRDNTSGVRGVSFHRHTGKWWAYADHHGQRHSAGLFVDKADAEAAVIALRNRLFTHNDADRT